MTPLQTEAHTEGLPSGSIEDKELALAFKRGEKGAYQAIHDRYSARVMGVCKRMLCNPQDAEEAAQETFLRTYRALTQFNGRYQLGAWITRIATNVCLDQLRSSQRRPVAPAPIEELEGLPELINMDADPQVHVVRHSEGRRVRKVLDGLPPLHRAAIVLRDFEGLSYQEISVALAITEPQVKALLHRARQGFKRTWLEVAVSALIPWRLWDRVRKVEVSAKDQMQYATSSGTPIGDLAANTAQAASSCGVFLHHCGQVAMERAAPLVLAAFVGGAATAAVGHANRAPVIAHVQETSTEVGNPTANPKVKVIRKAPNTRAKAANDPAPVAPAPASSPTSGPAPEDQPSSGGESAPQPSASPQPTSKPTPTPTPFTIAMGFDRGRSIPASAPAEHAYTLDCARRSFEQTIRTVIHDGDASYPALLWMKAGSRTGRLELTLWKEGVQYKYTSWGQEPHATWVANGTRIDLGISGSYGATYGYDPSADELPKSGSFSIRLAIECATPSLTTEGVTFTAE